MLPWWVVCCCCILYFVFRTAGKNTPTDTKQRWNSFLLSDTKNRRRVVVRQDKDKFDCCRTELNTSQPMWRRRFFSPPSFPCAFQWTKKFKFHFGNTLVKSCLFNQRTHNPAEKTLGWEINRRIFILQSLDKGCCCCLSAKSDMTLWQLYGHCSIRSCI